MASLFNILGLSVAFAAFAIISIQVKYEYDYDKCYPEADKIFRVSMDMGNNHFFAISRPIAEELAYSSAHIKAFTLLYPYIGEVYFTLEDDNNKKGYRKALEVCTPDITRIFGFSIAEGDSACLNNPNNVIIPQSFARTLFKDSSAIGKTISFEENIVGTNYKDFVIGGVYHDFPENSQVRNDIYVPLDKNYLQKEYGALNFLSFVLLDNKDAANGITESFNKSFDQSRINWGDNRVKIILTPVTDIYFMNESQDGNVTKSGNKETTKLLFCIAVLVIIIATVNYINFSTSLAPVRIRNINTRKVLGCTESLLRLTIILEAVVITFFSYLLSILYIVFFNTTNALSFIEADLSIVNNLPILFVVGLFALIIGLLSGLYPAYYMTSWPPALVLKGNFGLSVSGRKLRIGLICLQYVVSIGLITGAAFVWLQNRYMQNFSLGFDKDQIAIVELTKGMVEDNRENYVNQLKSFSGIEDVAFAADRLGAKDNYPNIGMQHKDQIFQFYRIPVSWNFIELMGIPLIEGDKPTPADMEADNIAFFFNKDVREKYGLEPGDPLDFFKGKSFVKGIIGNAKFTSLRGNDDNLAFVISSYILPFSYIRIKAGTDYAAAVNHIRKVVKQIDPGYPVSVEFYDTMFDQLYRQEENLRKMVTVFCLMAIIISIVGVFGLIIFENEYKRKEMGIRKVFGSSVKEILILFNKEYLRIVLICFVIAVPLIYFIVEKWLEGFAYKIPVYWWVFPVSGLLVLSLTLFVVTIQSWKTARENPVDTLKGE